MPIGRGGHGATSAPLPTLRIYRLHVIASNPGATRKELDCHVASAPRNDGERFPPTSPRHCERSAAIQKPRRKNWIATAQARLAMTGTGFRQPLPVIASEARQSRSHKEELDCHGASEPRNDGERFPPASPRHCERSAAIQESQGRTGLPRRKRASQ